MVRRTSSLYGVDSRLRKELKPLPKQVTVVKHPIILEQLSIARNKNSNQIEFRKAIYRIGRHMAYEFMRTLELQEYSMETPLSKTTGYRVLERDKVLIVLVLRAAIPFVEGLYKMFPMARTGIISAWRGPAPKFKVDVNYVKIPDISQQDTVMVADPMLATGNTLIEIGKKVLQRGRPKRLVFISVLAVMVGIKRIIKEFPEAEIYTCAIDPELNRKGYIVPGLGDAGDRCFGSPERHEIK